MKKKCYFHIHHKMAVTRKFNWNGNIYKDIESCINYTKIYVIIRGKYALVYAEYSDNPKH